MELYWTFNSFSSFTASMVPCRPIHLNAGFLLLRAWHFSMSPMDWSTLAISYSLLILVFSFCSPLSSTLSGISQSDIFLAASSRLRTCFHVTNRWMNCWQRIPRDFSFLYFFCLLPLPILIKPDSSSSDWISMKLGSICGSWKLLTWSRLLGTIAPV